MKQMEKTRKINQYFQKNKNYYFIGLGIICAFIIGLALNLGMTKKVAMVDVQKVVNSSAIVNTLKLEYQSKRAELNTWLSNAEKEIEKETVSSKKEKLTKKYQQELTQKQQAIQQAYTQELQKIDALISEDITRIANEKGYSLVLVKGMVISGADDITEFVIEGVR